MLIIYYTTNILKLIQTIPIMMCFTFLNNFIYLLYDKYIKINPNYTYNDVFLLF